jgi:hypothetical protein
VEGDEMTLAFNRGLNREIDQPELVQEQESSLDVSVIFTSVDSTVAALKKAGSLAESLGGRITLVVPQIVPYPLPLTSPPVLLNFQERRFREIAKQIPANVRVQIYLCRDCMETLKCILKPHSLVVVGARKRFWPTRENGIVRKLRRMGHDVIFTETE